MEETNFKTANYESNYKMTVEDMWKTTNMNNDNGIEGYELVKKYFDHLKAKEYKKVWDKNNSKKVKVDWPPHSLRDENGKVNWPKRKNYLDDIEKWAKSFYNKEKAEKVMEYLEDKGRPLNKKTEKKEIAEKLQRMKLQGDRKTFIDLIKRYEEKKYHQYPDKEDAIQDLKDKLTEYYKNKKTPLQETMEKYRIKGSMPKCDRITIVSDAEHTGEKLPFCYQVNEEDANNNPEGKKKEKFKNKITYPSKNPIWNRAPSWKIYGPLKKTEEEQGVLDNKRDMDRERARSAKETLISKLKVKNLDLKVIETFNKMKNFGNSKIAFGKKTYLNDEEKERYKEFLKENPKKQPGPTYYWKTKPIGKDFKKEKSKKKLETIVNDDGTKTHYVERSVTDKIISRPMSSHIF